MDLRRPVVQNSATLHPPAPGIKLVLNSRVSSVEDGCVKVVNKANEVTEIK